MDMIFIVTNTVLKEQAIMMGRTEEAAWEYVRLLRPQWEQKDLTIHAVLSGTVIFRKI